MTESAEKVEIVKFKVQARCDVAPDGKPSRYYATDDQERRIKGANSCYVFDLDRKRTRLDDDKIVLVATIPFRVERFRSRPTIADAARAVLAWLRWTLQIVYGVGDGAHDPKVPMPHLKVTIEELGRPT